MDTRRRWPIGLAILSLFSLVLPKQASAEDVPLQKYAVEVNYSGLGLQYRFSPRWSADLRAQATKDIFVGGLRGNFHFKPRWGIQPYMGVEADYVNFEGNNTKGTGYATDVFLGAEYYFRRSWSAVIDVGSAYISVKDDDTDVEESGMEGVINIGFRYHFGREISQ